MTNKTTSTKRTGRARAKNSKTTPEAIERWERDLNVVRLRRAGIDWTTIAQQTGLSSAGHAYQRFMAIMKEYPREDVEAARQLEADRLDQMQRAIWPKVLQGDTWSIDRALKISDQRARLLGLNMPVKQEITVLTEDTVDAAIRQLQAELEARAVEAGVEVPTE